MRASCPACGRGCCRAGGKDDAAGSVQNGLFFASSMLRFLSQDAGQGTKGFVFWLMKSWILYVSGD